MYLKTPVYPPTALEVATTTSRSTRVEMGFDLRCFEVKEERERVSCVQDVCLMYRLIELWT